MNSDLNFQCPVSNRINFCFRLNFCAGRVAAHFLPPLRKILFMSASDEAVDIQTPDQSVDSAPPIAVSVGTNDQIPSSTNNNMATGGSDKIKAKVLDTRRLGENEDFTSFKAWQTSLKYSLRKDERFIRFLDGGETWSVKSDNPADLRGLVDDDATKTPQSLTAHEKLAHLQDFLTVICQFVPHFLSTKIIYSSTSINSIWQFVREYYSLDQSESSFIKFLAIHQEEGERPMRLYYRLLSHVSDNLLTKDSKLLHNGQVYGKDEILTPTLERYVVLRWLELLDPRLPNLVLRYFSHELRQRSLKDLQPLICNAYGDLMNLLSTEPGEASVNAIGYGYVSRPSFRQNFGHPGKKPKFKPTFDRSKPKCSICKKLGQPSHHQLADCPQLTHQEKESIAHAFSIQVQVDGSSSDETSEEHLE